MKRQLIALSVGASLLVGGVALAATDNFKTDAPKVSESPHLCPGSSIILRNGLNRNENVLNRDCFGRVCDQHIILRHGNNLNENRLRHECATPTPSPSPSVSASPAASPSVTNVTNNTNVTTPTTTSGSTSLPDVGGHGTLR